MNPAERRRAFQGMVEIFDQDPPAIILHRFGVFYAKVKNLKWDAYPHVYMDFRRGVASL